MRPSAPSSILLQEGPKILNDLHLRNASLAEELWQLLHKEINHFMYFGLAVDTGIDRVKSEHIMIAVLYVECHEFVLPPSYSTSHKAYDGYMMAKELLSCLSSNFGGRETLKTEVLDGRWLYCQSCCAFKL